MAKIKVDKEKCIGCSTCSALFPKVFAIGDDGKSSVISNEELSDEEIDQAISSCPAGAISKK